MGRGATSLCVNLALSVVVPTRARPLRLRWLLNELEGQTLAAERFEVLVAHPVGDPAPEVVARHPLGRAGRARSVPVTGGAGRAAARNAGWRAARAPLVAFTHDDCRPPPGWLEDLEAIAREAPGIAVQGAVEPDPEESAYLFARVKRVRRSRPPDPLGPACNIAFPRVDLEALSGFDEARDAEWLDGAELAARAGAAGRSVRPAPDMHVFHAVRPLGPATWLRDATSLAGLPAAVKRTPALRDGLALGVAVRPTHLLALLAVASGAAATRRPVAAALTAPWLARLAVEQRARGSSWGQVLARLPLRAAGDLASVAVLAAGSARARALCL